MKKLVILFGFLNLGVTNLEAQDFKNFFERLNSFNKFEQYDEVDQEILEVSNYIISAPIQRKNFTEKYYYAVKSLVKWCSHTESYRIFIFGKVIESCNDDDLMKNMYMAAMAKYLIEQRYENNRHVFPEKQPDIKYSELPEVKETLLEGAKIFFDYLENVADERPNKELRRGIKAANEGTLEAYMFE
ncbi:MAG: hypothetical protein ACOCXH_06580 [Cyclobacteriaceae bacterium]